MAVSTAASLLSVVESGCAIIIDLRDRRKARGRLLWCHPVPWSTWAKVDDSKLRRPLSSLLSSQRTSIDRLSPTVEAVGVEGKAFWRPLVTRTSQRRWSAETRDMRGLLPPVTTNILCLFKSYIFSAEWIRRARERHLAQ